jgi:uncharacterized membrane protein YedE/YeeE
MIDTLFPLGIAHYLLGGLCIGAGVSWLYFSTGLIGGMSSFFSSTWSFVIELPFFQQSRYVSSRTWRVVYAVGLISGAALWMLTVGEPFQTTVSWWQLGVGGFIAGFGARLSGGCTSGHGICGLGALQLPSLMAVVIFLTTAMVTANVVLFMGGV